MNLLWLESAVAASTMLAWVQRDGRKLISCCIPSRKEFLPYGTTCRLYDEALLNLSRLHIMPNSTVKLALNSTFKACLRQALTGG